MSDQKTETIKYLDTHVNNIVKPLMKSLVLQKPDNVCDFIVDWIERQGREIEKKRVERQSSQNEDSHLPTSEESVVEDEAQDDFDLNKIKEKQRNTKKKNAISAEAYGEYNKLENFKPRVIEKTDEQKQQIAQILSKNFMFKNLDSREQDIIIEAMEIKTYQPEENVIKQGDDGEELFIVSTGKLTCSKLFEGNPEPKFLRDYESGEVFGELALMYNAPRAANIDAKEESVCFSLDRDTFNHIVKNAAIEKRKKYDGFLQKIEILSTLSQYEREKICDCLQIESHKRDELVIKEGEEGSKFYLIQEGTADALQNKEGQETKVYEYQANDYFGELALLKGDKRKASIKVTSEELVVAVIDKDSFKRLLGNIEDILKRNQSKYEQFVQK